MERDVRMWNCIKCNAVNEDIYTICPKCGASRSAGRFGSAAPVKTVPYPAAESKPRPQNPESKPAPAQPIPQVQEYIPQPDKVRAGGGVRFFGRLLMVFLPLLTALLAYLKKSTYQVQLSVMLFGNAVSESNILLIIVYVLFSLGAVLLSFLPGLWTLSLGKLLLRFARMEELL